MISVVCMIVARMPISFGPYQNQAYLLSRELDRLGYSMRWMMTSAAFSLPEDVYDTVEAVRDKIPSKDAMPEHPPGYNLSHLKYVGITREVQTTRVSDLNRLAAKYSIDAYIALMDFQAILVRDADFKVPAIAWLPQHFDHVPPWDTYILKAFTAIAPLAPSTAELFQPRLHPLPVKYIPHIIDPELVENLEGEPTQDNDTAEELSVPPGTFVVLFQNGNWYQQDRKGVDVGIQAFERFHAIHPNSVLLIHAISFESLASQTFGSKTKSAPQGAIPKEGMPLRSVLAATNLSESAYWIDERLLSIRQVFEYKRMANVCLHPSKTEGFGMNMMECQAVGTPVVSTGFMAMGDFTRYGVAVPIRQQTMFASSMVAQPDVPGVVDALVKAYHSEGDFSLERRDETLKWIGQNFSLKRVGRMFQRMLEMKSSVALAKKRRKTPSKLYTLITESSPPVVDIDTLWVLCRKPGVEIDDAKAQFLLARAHEEHPGTEIIVIGAQFKANQSTVPLTWDDGTIHPDLPYLMRTQTFLQLQTGLGNVRRIAASVLTGPQEKVQVWPTGIAFV